MHNSADAEPRITHLLRKVFAATRLEIDFITEHHPGSVPDLTIEFTGADAPCLTVRNAELLKALEHIAAKVRGLDPDQHDLLSFDTNDYKRNRDLALQHSAQRAADRVRATGEAFSFPPMSSRERRQLHLVLTAAGLLTASSGEGSERRVILYPPSQHGMEQPPKPI